MSVFVLAAFTTNSYAQLLSICAPPPQPVSRQTVTPKMGPFTELQPVQDALQDFVASDQSTVTYTVAFAVAVQSQSAGALPNVSQYAVMVQSSPVSGSTASTLEPPAGW